MRGLHSSRRRRVVAGLLTLATLVSLLVLAHLAQAEEIPPTPPDPRELQPPPGVPDPADVNSDPGSDLTGHWEGVIRISGGDLPILLDFGHNDEGDLAGTMDSPMQGAKGVPLIEIVVNGDRVDFAISGGTGNPHFKGRFTGGEITGDFTQSGQTFPFAFGRKPLAKAKRPQDPKAPFSYRAEEVTYQGGDVTFAGTLTIPEGEGPFPAVLLITGSGPQNRDEEVFNHRPFAVLADFLTRAGIAVLRVDDRGVGGTTGAGTTITTDDLAVDALAGVAFLRTRPEVDRKKIGLIGHSEGGIIAPIVATRSKDVAFIVMLAGSGVPGSQVLINQSEMISRSQGVTEEVLNDAMDQMRAVIELVGAGADTAAVRAKLEETVAAQMASAADSNKAAIAASAGTFRQQLGIMTSPWFRHFITYDPRPVLRQVKVPVLALDGELDMQVPPDQNLPEIEKALREGKNMDYTVKELPGLNHLLQPAKTGAIAEYASIETTMDPAALEMIRDWILRRFGKN